MKTGLLIYDDDAKATLEDKVRRAAAQYQARFGQAPTACYVHPGALSAGGCVVPGLEIQPWRTILPNHLWVGLAETRN